MIRVQKPSAPTKLNEGKELTKANCESYDAYTVDYNEGKRKFDFHNRIYGHKTVRDVLEKAQFQKCCFCEGKFTANAAGDVEHYRPKGAVQNDEKSSKEFPGYFWLAYSWENLYWSCQICNRSNKRSLFPLRNPTLRAQKYTDSINLEEPLIINPGGSEDPRDHVKFREEFAVGQTEAAKTTIRVLGLNRPGLIEDRRNRLAELRTILRIARLLEMDMSSDLLALKEEALCKLTEWVRPDSKYSAMVSDYLNEIPEIKFQSID